MDDILLHPLPWGIATLFGGVIGSSMLQPTQNRKLRVGRFVFGSLLTLLVLEFSGRSSGSILIGYVGWAAGIALMISAKEPPSARS